MGRSTCHWSRAGSNRLNNLQREIWREREISRHFLTKGWALLCYRLRELKGPVPTRCKKGRARANRKNRMKDSNRNQKMLSPKPTTWHSRLKGTKTGLPKCCRKEAIQSNSASSLRQELWTNCRRLGGTGGARQLAAASCIRHYSLLQLQQTKLRQGQVLYSETSKRREVRILGFSEFGFGVSCLGGGAT